MRFLISYTVTSSTGSIIKEGTVRSKLAENEFLAKVRFENHCKNKYKEFHKLVIHSCKEESSSPFGDLPDGWDKIFGDIFK